jgi:hypothetical protein
VIRIGTSERGGTFHGQGFALKALLDREAGLAPVEIREAKEASMENAQRLEAGEIDFGFIAANWMGRAARGEPPFAEKMNLRVAAPMNAGPLFFIARAADGPLSVAELAGKRVVFGVATSGMAQHAKAIFAALGIEVQPVFLDFAAGGAAVMRGEAAAQLQCPIPNPVMSALDARAALRVLPYAPGDLERVLAQVPFYRPILMRKGALRALDADVAQVAVLNLLATHARTPDAVVTALVRALIAGREELPRLNPLFIGLGELFARLRQEGATAFEKTVALHPGAGAAYRAAGLLV